MRFIIFINDTDDTVKHWRSNKRNSRHKAGTFLYVAETKIVGFKASLPTSCVLRSGSCLLSLLAGEIYNKDYMSLRLSFYCAISVHCVSHRDFIFLHNHGDNILEPTVSKPSLFSLLQLLASLHIEYGCMEHHYSIRSRWYSVSQRARILHWFHNLHVQ
jgi:hypothetical protein